MDHSSDLRIDEVIGLLHKVNVETAQELQAEFPNYKDLFRVGQTMGGGVPYKVLLAATQRSLAEIGPWGERAINRCQKRLSMARRLELWGALVAILGSAGSALFATLRANDKTIMAAGIAVIGNLCATMGNYYRGSLMRGKQGLEESYMTLLQAMPEMRMIELQIAELAKEHRGNPIIDKEVKALLERAQFLCKEVYRASKQIPER